MGFFGFHSPVRSWCLYSFWCVHHLILYHKLGILSYKTLSKLSIYHCRTSCFT